MGAAGTISAAMKNKRVSKDQIAASASASLLLNFFNFNDFADDHGTISLEDIFKIFAVKTDVFLTHDWGVNQFNHKRVSKINKALQSRGITTWFDDEQMEGDIKSKMTTGIDQSRVVITFITSRYMKKVAGSNAEDNCRLEFGYACRRKTGARMLPIVMEAEIRDTSQWEGQVGLVLGGSLYVDLADEDGFEAKIDNIMNRVVKIMGPPLKNIIENINWAELQLDFGADIAKPTTVEQHEAASSSAGSNLLYAELVSWFTKEVKIVPRVAEKYGNKLLIDAEVGSVDRLRKKVKKNKNFLREMHFDEDDVEDINKVILGSETNSVTAAPPKSEPPASPAKATIAAPAAEPSSSPAQATVRNYDHFLKLIGHSGGIYGMIPLQDLRICSACADSTAGT